VRLKWLVLVAAVACGPTAVSPDAAAPDAPRAIDAPPTVDAGPDAPPDAPEFAPRYTSDRTLSPITAAVARNLRNIAALNGDFLQDDVFAKIGDSITVDTHFMTCFAGTGVNLDGRTELQPAIDTFKAHDAAGASSFERVSLAATVGWSADSAIAGDPSPVDEEVAAIMPRYAVVMFGTNDAASRSIYTYAASLWTIVDTLAAEGVVPIMSSVPPNSQSTTVDAVVPRFNAVSRGLAQARLYPYMDYYKEMAPLPNRGLGPDGLHPSVDAAGSCKLDAAGLQFGYNVRNLLTIQSLARAQAAVEGGAPPDPEPGTPAVGGNGSYDKPFGISGFPFTDMRDTSQSQNTMFTHYTGCGAAQDESGPEFIYRLVLSAPATVRATVMVRGNTDVDVHLLSALDVASCLQRNDKEVVAALQPGTYYFSLDTFVPADGTPRVGEYLFLVTSE